MTAGFTILPTRDPVTPTHRAVGEPCASAQPPWPSFPIPLVRSCARSALRDGALPAVCVWVTHVPSD